MLNPAQDGFCPEKVLSGSTHSALHDPLARVTPEQRREHLAHRLRLDRLAKSARAFNRPNTVKAAKPETPQTEPVFSMGDWVARQKEIHKPVPPYQTWFAVEEDITAPPQPIRIEDIQRACAKHYGVTLRDILSVRRASEVVRPRQVGYYLSKVLTFRSLPEIGRRFRRDHTSALSGIRKIERLRKTDPDLQADLNAIASALGGSLAN